MLRDHRSFYRQEVESEKKIDHEFEDRLFRNWPVCKFFRRRDEKTRKLIRRLEERLVERTQMMLTGAQNFVDKNRGKSLACVCNHANILKTPSKHAP